MSDKCPKCGAGIEEDHGGWLKFYCKTIKYKPAAGFPGSYSHGSTCKDRQMANLNERLEAWRAIEPFAMWNYRDGAEEVIQKLKDLGEV